MDTLTILAAWTGAITGLGSLGYQLWTHRRGGALLKLEGHPVWVVTNNVVSDNFREIQVVLRNRGRHATGLEWVALYDRRVGRLRRQLAVRRIRPLEARGVFTLARPGEIKVGALSSSQTIHFRGDHVREKLGDDVDKVFLAALTSAGKFVRGPSVSLRRGDHV